MRSIAVTRFPNDFAKAGFYLTLVHDISGQAFLSPVVGRENSIGAANNFINVLGRWHYGMGTGYEATAPSSRAPR